MSLEAKLRRHAEQVTCDLDSQNDAWGGSGWTRRRFIGGAGMVGAAALASQLVTTRAAFGATSDTTTNTVVLIFLRGAADGLRIVVPNSADLGLTYLRQVRPQLIPADSSLVALDNGWALNTRDAAALRHVVVDRRARLRARASPIPASAAATSRRSSTSRRAARTRRPRGWLDRTLAKLGPGTTFRAVTAGGPTPLSLLGPETTLAMDQLSDFTFPGWDDDPRVLAEGGRCALPRHARHAR